MPSPDEVNSAIKNFVESLKDVPAGEVIICCLVENHLVLDTLVKNNVISVEQKNAIMRCTSEAVGRISARYRGKDIYE